MTPGSRLPLGGPAAGAERNGRQGPAFRDRQRLVPLEPVRRTGFAVRLQPFVL